MSRLSTFVSMYVSKFYLSTLFSDLYFSNPSNSTQY